MYDCAAVLCPLHGRCSLLLFGCRRVARATAPLPARSHCTAHIDIVHTNAHASGWPCTRHGSVCLPCTVPCDWCCVLSSATPLPSTGFASFLGFFPHCTSLHSHHSTPALTAHAHSCACVALECYVLLPLCVCVCVAPSLPSLWQRHSHTYSYPLVPVDSFHTLPGSFSFVLLQPVFSSHPCLMPTSTTS